MRDETDLNWLATARADCCVAISFLTRLPVARWCRHHVGSAASFLRFAPLAGCVVGGISAVVCWLGAAVNVPAPASAVLAVAAQIWATGALHEDGLADVADGFGGGADRDRKLAIMRDSRIGTFGACALGCSLLLRVVCIAELLQRGSVATAAAGLVIGACLSRALMLAPMVMLPLARSDGLARSVGALPQSSLFFAAGVALIASGLACATSQIPPRGLLMAIVMGLAASAMLTELARRQIGGMTGDVVGATQQVSELAVLVTLSAALASG